MSGSELVKKVLDKKFGGNKSKMAYALGTSYQQVHLWCNMWNPSEKYKVKLEAILKEMDK